MGPQLYLILALVAAVPSTYGYMWIKQQVLVTRAYESGKKVGREEVAAATNTKSRDVVASVESGEREAPIVDPARQKIVELCKRSASCRERGK